MEEHEFKRGPIKITDQNRNILDTIPISLVGERVSLVIKGPSGNIYTNDGFFQGQHNGTIRLEHEKTVNKSNVTQIQF